jgi:hypothetical protein
MKMIRQGDKIPRKRSKKVTEFMVRGRGIVALSLALFFFAGIAGCRRGSPAEPSPTIVGTWHNNWSGWRKNFDADGSYSAKLYGSSYKITETGRYHLNGKKLTIEITQYNSGTACASGCFRVVRVEIFSMTESELILGTSADQRNVYRRVT